MQVDWVFGEKFNCPWRGIIAPLRMQDAIKSFTQTQRLYFFFCHIARSSCIGIVLASLLERDTFPFFFFFLPRPLGILGMGFLGIDDLFWWRLL